MKIELFIYVETFSGRSQFEAMLGLHSHLVRDEEPIELEVIEGDYANTLEKIDNLFNTIFFRDKEKYSFLELNEKYDQIKKKIDNSITNETEIIFLEDYCFEWKEDNIDRYLIKYPNDLYKTTIPKCNKLFTIFKENLSQTEAFIKENRDAIFLMLDNKISNITNGKKQRRMEANKRYYEKHKVIEIKPEKIELTLEEKKLRQKEYNIEYKNKMKNLKQEKILTPEQEKRRLQNKQHYEKRKLKLIQIDM